MEQRPLSNKDVRSAFRAVAGGSDRIRVAQTAEVLARLDAPVDLAAALSRLPEDAGALIAYDDWLAAVADMLFAAPGRASAAPTPRNVSSPTDDRDTVARLTQRVLELTDASRSALEASAVQSEEADEARRASEASVLMCRAAGAETARLLLAGDHVGAQKTLRKLSLELDLTPGQREGVQAAIETLVTDLRVHAQQSSGVMSSMPDGSPARATAEVESESVRLLGDLSNKLAKYLVAVRSDGRLSGEMVLFINSCKEAVDDCLHVCEGEKRMRANIAHEHGKMYLQVSQLRDELDRATRKSKAAQQRVTSEENCSVS